MSPSSTRVRALLIRHAQASFGAADYDRLSARGERQAELLGAWVAAHPEWKLQRLVRGSMHRHAQTLEAILRACASAGRPMPDVVEDAGWNEFDHVNLFRGYAKRFSGDERLELLTSDPSSPAVPQLIADMFAAWARGDVDDLMPERWTEFTQRVHRAFNALAQHPGHCLVVSSGGVISRCAQAALHLSDERTISLNMSLANSAISDFRHRGDGWDLLTWNGLPHLAAAEHLPLTSHF